MIKTNSKQHKKPFWMAIDWSSAQTKAFLFAPLQEKFLRGCEKESRIARDSPSGILFARVSPEIRPAAGGFFKKHPHKTRPSNRIHKKKRERSKAPLPEILSSQLVEAIFNQPSVTWPLLVQSVCVSVSYRGCRQMPSAATLPVMVALLVQFSIAVPAPPKVKTAIPAA